MLGSADGRAFVWRRNGLDMLDRRSFAFNFSNLRNDCRNEISMQSQIVTDVRPHHVACLELFV